MKKFLHFGFLSLLCIIAAPALVEAGEHKMQLWTSTYAGGSHGLGVLYTVNEDGTQGGAVINFDGANGANPNGTLVRGVDNKLYGTTQRGGQYDLGVLFSYNPSDSIFEVLHHFNGMDGSYPGDLVISSSGRVYGTTTTGGPNLSPDFPSGAGVLFSYEPSNKNFEKLVDFDGLSGAAPQGLMEAADGNLYGMCRQGGFQQTGVIFCYQPLLAQYATIYNFFGTEGELPTKCKLIQASNGLLYGMTTWGGNTNQGVLFSYNVPTLSVNKLHDFNGVDGAYPSGTLLQASNGLLYGVTAYGGDNGTGEIFSYNIGTGVYTAIYSFDESLGSAPIGSLIEVSPGVLYGVTPEGGTYGLGVVFNYNISQHTYEVVSNCDGSLGGAQPINALVQYATGINKLSETQFAVYPNPASSNVNFNTGDFRPEFISISNADGKSVLKAAFTHSIDLSTLAPGVYIIELKNETAFARKRIVKE
ncbi:MAG: choice-of-anchor tandem repeat GloVer-containing protein [Chitinophagales bacterium]